MVDLTHCLTNLLFCDVPLLYYYTNLNSSKMCCLFSGDIYIYIYICKVKTKTTKILKCIKTLFTVKT